MNNDDEPIPLWGLWVCPEECRDLIDLKAGRGDTAMLLGWRFWEQCQPLMNKPKQLFMAGGDTISVAVCTIGTGGTTAINQPGFMNQGLTLYNYLPVN